MDRLVAASAGGLDELGGVGMTQLVDVDLDIGGGTVALPVRTLLPLPRMRTRSSSSGRSLRGRRVQIAARTLATAAAVAGP
ncbi:hypothetical protein [Nonomuraea sp. NPDC049695]|uniref:hypothetical protein n=1 Tax=Nonomuraea sp. NPDC049695 TaxID=3154734 RepID=UPI00341407B1